MINVSEDDDERARLLKAIPRHTRPDGTVNLTSLAREFGLHRSNMKRRVVALSASGALGTNPVLPGFMIKQTTAQYRGGEMVGESVKQVPEGDVTEAVPKGFAIKGVSTLRDAHGRTIIEWTKTREEPSVIDIAETLKTAFADYEPAAKPVRAQYMHYVDGLALYPLPDLHIGSFSWGKETGDDWDLKISETKIGGAMSALAGMTPSTKLGIVLGGGDAMHADNNSNLTTRSYHALQVDGRYQKVLGVACRLFAKQTDLALLNHELVIVRVLRGNHDENSATAISYFLSAWYRNEPRVRVDLDPSLFWWYRFGKTFLDATHGHEAKSKEDGFHHGGPPRRGLGEVGAPLLPHVPSSSRRETAFRGRRRHHGNASGSGRARRLALRPRLPVGPLSPIHRLRSGKRRSWPEPGRHHVGDNSMNKIPVIALKGRASSGKTTAAKYLLGKGYGRTSFAAPMRNMLNIIGVSDREMAGKLKESPCAALSGRTPREALQLLGTEWGRSLHPDLWVNLWRTRAKAILARGFCGGVVVDDCRFANEAAMVRSLGGAVIEIVNVCQESEPVGIAGHMSETQSFDPDITVFNDGRDLAGFHAAIDQAMGVLTQPAFDEAA